MLAFFTSRIKERFQTPDTQVFKAVEAGTKTIAGFICLTLESGEESGKGEEVLDPTQKVMHQIPEFLNLEFVISSGNEIEGLKALMKGSTHYCEFILKVIELLLLTRADILPFCVSPSHQSRGFGTKLLNHCLSR